MDKKGAKLCKCIIFILVVLGLAVGLLKLSSFNPKIPEMRERTRRERRAEFRKREEGRKASKMIPVVQVTAPVESELILELGMSISEVARLIGRPAYEYNYYFEGNFCMAQSYFFTSDIASVETIEFRFYYINCRLVGLFGQRGVLATYIGYIPETSPWGELPPFGCMHCVPTTATGRIKRGKGLRWKYEYYYKGKTSWEQF